ncbi:LOW QUALITY PROTEIN: hypothetical protein OSB04_001245 [Centaurea solstitialis]|uniref:Uncharacterized protein n=1 Tax=Centaurea solstitialis TaxID=347529 RepID=A0AA38WUB7_9ASTR|nr:LOW QUALITY PROTEIN: hypothetical protein OSB04_001245 [Centaurea solstitialis]
MNRWRPLLTVFFLIHLLSFSFSQSQNSFPFHKKTHKIKGPIKTLVVLVMENRSFDHMLGWIKKTRPDIDGLTGKEYNHVNATDPESEKSQTTPFSWTRTRATRSRPSGNRCSGRTRPEPARPDERVRPAGELDGRPRAGPDRHERVSNRAFPAYTRGERVRGVRPVVRVGARFDRANRLYVHSATSHGASSNVRRDLINGYPQKTIFDSLDENALTFGVYYQNVPTTLFFQNLRKLKFGKLPNYVVVEQRYFDVSAFPANDDHPSHDVAVGQAFVKEVYEILRGSPQWDEMALLITYDEHGGFYDHVATRWTVFRTRMGSWVRNRITFVSQDLANLSNAVIHEPSGPTSYSQFEHSSLPATVKKLFNLDSNFLTKRDAWAGTFESYFNLRDTPRDDCPEQLPEIKVSLRPRGPIEEMRLTEFQIELIQLASQLNGDLILNTYPDIGKYMTVGEAHQYAHDAITRFLEAGRAALMAGANESAVVTMRSSLSSRSLQRRIQR